MYDDTQAMLTSHPYINQVHTIGRQWRKGWLAQFRLYRELLNTLKARQYDVLINLTEHWHGARLARRLKPACRSVSNPISAAAWRVVVG